MIPKKTTLPNTTSQPNLQVPLSNKATALGIAPQELVLQIDYLRIPYYDAGKGPAIIFVSCAVCSLDIWEKWVAKLTGYRTICLQLPLHLGTCHGSGMGMVAYAELLNKCLLKLGLHRAIWAGNAISAQMVYELAHLYPGRVQKMVLVAPTGFTSYKSSTWLQKLTDAHDKVLANKQLQLNAWTASGTLNAKGECYKQVNRQVFMDALQNDFKTVKPTGEVEVPTLLLWGENDKVVPVEDAGKFKTVLTNVRFITYPQAGHFVFEEKPEETWKDLGHFLLNAH